MSTRKIIVLLFSILLVTIGFSVLRKPSAAPAPAPLGTLPAPTPTPLPPTGTFVDSVLGRFVYYQQGKFFDVQLPARTVTQLAGVDAEIIDTFPSIRPVWSSDGKLFAFVVNDHSIGVVTYATGARVAKFTLDPRLDLSKNIEISFSPDSKFLAVKQEMGDVSQLRFFSLTTRSLVSTVSTCSYQGFWLSSSSTYATRCSENQQHYISLLHPDGSITNLGAPNTYSLLNEFDSHSLLVKRGTKAGTLSLTGQFSLLDQKQIGSTSLDAFAHLERALADRIETQMKTEAIDDLVVAPSNAFALFHTHRGLWIVNLPLKDTPYFLFSGSLPSVQPL